MILAASKASAYDVEALERSALDSASRFSHVVSTGMLQPRPTASASLPLTVPRNGDSAIYQPFDASLTQ